MLLFCLAFHFKMKSPHCGAWEDLLLLSSGLSPFVNKDGP